ncbi:MAG: hypothetical protein HC866_08535 [Leptolyngbyaceae cyanobacterium RU_5_1]|nr:hypothetical protein [Leptolyngbyaceae cyanobacterium RU_5_1]
MNAPTFDTHSSICPICHRRGAVKSHKLIAGLLTCQYCRERLVVSWSGHYVRDPFAFRHLNVERTLRRDSHPLSRILRDLGATRSAFLIAALAGTALIGVSSLFQDKLFLRQQLSSEQTSPNPIRPTPHPNW